MKRRLKTKSNIYSYLKSSGILENGTHEEIQHVRKEYWREYKRNWRKSKRNIVKEITISLEPDEFKEITNESKRHRLSRTEFIKQACFAYINKSFLVPDVKEVRKISQLLAMTYNTIQELIEENQIKNESGKSMMESVLNLEREILTILNHPKSLEEQIREHISKKLKYKDWLIELINSI